MKTKLLLSIVWNVALFLLMTTATIVYFLLMNLIGWLGTINHHILIFILIGVILGIDIIKKYLEKAIEWWFDKTNILQNCIIKKSEKS